MDEEILRELTLGEGTDRETLITLAYLGQEIKNPYELRVLNKGSSIPVKSRYETAVDGDKAFTALGTTFYLLRK